MKKYIYLLIVFIYCGLTSCNQDNTTDLPVFGPVSKDKLVGTWNWESTSDGLSEQISNSQSSGEKQLVLTKNSAYSLTDDHDEILFSGEYFIAAPDSINRYKVENPSGA